MRVLLLTAAASVVVAAPAAARDGSAYIGIEGGILFPKSVGGTLTATFSQSAQSPLAGTAAAAPGTGRVGALPVGLATAPGNITGGSRAKLKRGYDVDAIAGYDFGMFRLEAEVGYKRSRTKSFSVDPTFVTGVTTALMPAGTTVSGTPFVFPTNTINTFHLGHTNVLSGMVNGLLDFGIGSNASVFVGPGIGYARVRSFGDSDSALAYQGIAGVRFGIGPNLDIGLKYRYFRTASVRMTTFPAAFQATNTAVVANVPPSTPVGATASGTTNVSFTRNAGITDTFHGHFSSQSLLLSLAYNFGAAAAPPPPPPPAPPPPPPPPAPATQTCPDGSVIEATATCPAPPPPPPPPPPAQRGERGN